MSLSQDLMAAEAQIDALAADGARLGPDEAHSLCRFLRECAVGAMELEHVVHQTQPGGVAAD